MRDLIPQQYHILVVVGAIALCTVLTLLVITTTSVRSFKRHYLGRELTPEQHAQRDSKEATIMVVVNLSIVLAISAVVFAFTGFVSTIVALGGYVAVIGLLGHYCECQLRKRK